MTEPNAEVITAGASWPERYTYSPALRVSDVVCILGATGTDDDGNITAPGDIVEQTRKIFRIFERLLSAAAGYCADIVQTTDYITTTENYKATAAVRRKFLQGAQPTANGVIVAGLLREHALIEINAVPLLRS